MRDPIEVGELFRAYCANRFGGDVDLACAAPSGNGLDTQVVFVQVRGRGLADRWQRPLVLRIHPSAERAGQARHEAAVQSWCADQGYPAPRVIAVLEPGDLLPVPVQVIEHCPGRPMLDVMSKAPWKAGLLVDRLASLHLQLHALALAGSPAARSSLAERRLAFPRAVVPRLGDRGLSDALRRAEAVASTLEDGDRVVCHGDFHPMNVLVDHGRSFVIDWTDAGLGDRHGDVSRTAFLFDLAAVAAAGFTERMATKAFGPLARRKYLRVYTRAHPLDPERLRRWESLHCVHGWAQVVAADHGLTTRGEGGANRARMRPDVAVWLQARFERAIAGF